MFTFANVVKSVRSSVVAAIDSEVVLTTVNKLDRGLDKSYLAARNYASYAAAKTADVLKEASVRAAKLGEELDPAVGKEVQK